MDKFKEWYRLDWSSSESSVIYRPTETNAFRNLERKSKILRKYGNKNIYFTQFQWKIFDLEKELLTKEIPLAELKNSNGDRVKIPIVIHEIASRTNHTPDFISKNLKEIDEKIELREYLNFESLPDRTDKYIRHKKYNRNKKYSSSK